jgi:hypothetical protein
MRFNHSVFFTGWDFTTLSAGLDFTAIFKGGLILISFVLHLSPQEHLYLRSRVVGVGRESMILASDPQVLQMSGLKLVPPTLRSEGSAKRRHSPK